MIDEFNLLNIKHYVNYDLTDLNTMKLRSKAHVLVEPKDIDELKSVLDIVSKYKSKYFILGNGSNVILPIYYDGVCIKLNKLNNYTFDNGNIYAEAGCMINVIANDVSNRGYTGLEWASHIPGTIGGSIYSNAGAYKGQISDVITSITILDNGNIKTINNSEALFGYRTSIFRNDKNKIVLSCEMKVSKGNLEEIKSIIKERLDKRIKSQPLNYPSCGSVFRNPDDIAAGKLIDDLGLKGYNVGDLCISEKHANFIINKGKGSKEDYDVLVKTIKDKVKKEYNIDLILEQEVID